MTAVAYAKVIGAAVLALSLFLAGYHFGGLAPKLACVQAQVKTEALAQAKRTKDTATVAEEAKTYDAATDPVQPLPAPVVRVCRAPPAPAAVPNAAASGFRAHEATPLPAAAPRDPLPGPDIGRPVVQAGRDADAQIAGLQDYIAKVCEAGT